MEQNRKYILLTGAGAFVAGVAVTLTVFALTFCPARDYAKWHKSWRAEHPIMAKVRPMPASFNHGDFRGAREHGQDGRIEHRNIQHGDLRRDDMRRPEYPGFHPQKDMKDNFARNVQYDNLRRDDMRRPEYPGFHPQKDMKDNFVQKLGLTDEQKKQIDEFSREDMEKMEPLFKQMDELRKQADALRAENKARFESVLTAEQKEILQQMHQKRAERVEKARPGKVERKPAMRPTAGQAGQSENLPASENNVAVR